MEAIAIGQFKAGDQHGALHTAKLIPHDINRSGVLMHIAFAQARSGHVNGAIETVNHIKAPLRRDAVLLGIAFIQARADDIPGALATTRNMGSKLARARAYGEISQKGWLKPSEKKSLPRPVAPQSVSFANHPV
jgi:hypothetical protein